MKNLYLTIDDSPSPFTDEMIDYLEENRIPAVLFVRGAFLSDNPKPIIRAIEKGFVIGNHLFSHERCSEMDFVKIVEEIERTETMIDAAYVVAGRERTHRLIRFPHMDRGCGAQIVEYEKYTEYKNILEDIFLDGLNVQSKRPSPEMLALKHKLQIFLEREGFSQPFEGVSHPFFENTEMESAKDCMFTYSTADWMLTDRHKGKWRYKTIDDLINKIDNAPHLKDDNSADIVVMHDDRENILGVMKEILDYWKNQGVRFLSV